MIVYVYFSWKTIQVLVMVPKLFLKILLIFILCNWVFDKIILAEELFIKPLRNLENCALVNDNLWGKLFSTVESPTTLDAVFKVTSVTFFFLVLIYQIVN